MPPTTLPIGETENEKHKLLGLDHLRALAITLVFLFHYQIFGHPHWEESIAGFGWTGVDLFFVLSGFLIAGQLFGTIAKGGKVNMPEFFIKRFFRIIPPFLVILMLYAFIPFVRERQSMAPLWRYFTFTLNFGLDLREYGTFTHAWSLCAEEQFYLVLPVTFWLVNYFKVGKKAAYLLIALFIAGFMIRLWGWDHFVAPQLSSDSFWAVYDKYIYYPTYNRLDALLIGVSIAGLYTFHPQFKDRVNKHANLLLVTGLAILIGAYFLCTPQATFKTAIFGFPLIALGYGLIVAAVVCPASVFYQLKSHITSWLASLSYAIYLVHKMMIHVTQTVLANLHMDKNSGLVMLICIGTSIAGALVLRYAVEKPSLWLRDKVLGCLR